MNSVKDSATLQNNKKGIIHSFYYLEIKNLIVFILFYFA